MDKQILLVFEFNKAPKELKDQATTHKKSWERLERAKAQAKRWQSELREAEALHKDSTTKLQTLLNKWDPSGIESEVIKEKAQV